MVTRANEGFYFTAEFDRRKAVCIFWPRTVEPVKGYNAHKVIAEFTKILQDEGDVELYINCGHEGTIDNVRTALKAAGADIEKIHFTQFPDLTNWARDYGPDLLVDGKGNTQLVSFNFNVYGQAAPDFPMSVLGTNMNAHMALHMGCRDFVVPNIFSEGGDRGINGKGVLMTIENTEVTKRNPNMTREQVEQAFKDALNLKKIIWLPFPTYDDEGILDGPMDIIDGKPIYRSLSANGHIDEMCRFVNANTVLLTEVDEEEASRLNSSRITKERLDMAYEVLKNSTDADGNPINIVRIPAAEPIYIETVPGEWLRDTWGKRFDDGNDNTTLADGSPMPKDTDPITVQPALSYCNFLVCNNVVLAQRYWKEGLPLSIKERDEKAKQVLESVFPDRKVIALDTIALNIMGGGIHCMTKDIPVAD